MELDAKSKADMAIFEAIIADQPLAMKEILRTAWMNGFLTGVNAGTRKLARPLADMTKSLDSLCKAMVS